MRIEAGAVGDMQKGRLRAVYHTVAKCFDLVYRHRASLHLWFVTGLGSAVEKDKKAFAAGRGVEGAGCAPVNAVVGSLLREYPEVVEVDGNLGRERHLATEQYGEEVDHGGLHAGDGEADQAAAIGAEHVFAVHGIVHALSIAQKGCARGLGSGHGADAPGLGDWVHAAAARPLAAALFARA